MPQVRDREDAAVAMVLAGHPEALDVCFIRRAARQGDPWSGHVGFPGGRAAHSDAHLRHTAERETEEELGLRLDGMELLGIVPRVPIHKGTGSLTPFVYYLGATPPPLQLDRREVERAFWMPLSVLMDRERRTVLPWRGLAFPGIRLGDDDILWGLTLRVCDLWSQQVGMALGLDWPSLAQAR